MVADFVDIFSGCGGASLGIAQAGREVHCAVNHDQRAVDCHTVNHPEAIHHRDDVRALDPRDATGGVLCTGLWASPDCRHFSRAKGGAPVSESVRLLPYEVIRWAKQLQPEIVFVENVEEIVRWGPLDENGKEIPELRGTSFRDWVEGLRSLGYRVEYKRLDSADYGSYTSRRRLFLIAKKGPINWIEPTHGPGRKHPYRQVLDCIDFSIPAVSIFDNDARRAAGLRPIRAEKTHQRLAKGLDRYVIRSSNPVWVETPTSSSPGVAAWIMKYYGGVVGHSCERPIGAITGIDHHAICTATIGGKRKNGVAAWLMKYYGTAVGQRIDRPVDTITTNNKFALMTASVKAGLISDIGSRMLVVPELAKAQGFPDDFILPKDKKDAKFLIGNSVVPLMAKLLVEANT